MRIRENERKRKIERDMHSERDRRYENKYISRKYNKEYIHITKLCRQI